MLIRTPAPHSCSRVPCPRFIDREYATTFSRREYTVWEITPYSLGKQYGGLHSAQTVEVLEVLQRTSILGQFPNTSTAGSWTWVTAWIT